MKKKFIILIILAFLVQFSVLPIFFNGYPPNLLLIAALIIGVRKTALENLLWLMLAGLIFEIFSAETFGFGLLIFVLTGVVVWLFRNIILNKEYNVLIEILFWFLVKITWDLFYWISVSLFSFFDKNWFGDYGFMILNGAYIKETAFFIFSGMVMTMVYKKFFSDT